MAAWPLFSYRLTMADFAPVAAGLPHWKGTPRFSWHRRVLTSHSSGPTFCLHDFFGGKDLSLLSCWVVELSHYCLGHAKHYGQTTNVSEKYISCMTYQKCISVNTSQDPSDLAGTQLQIRKQAYTRLDWISSSSDSESGVWWQTSNTAQRLTSFLCIQISICSTTSSENLADFIGAHSLLCRALNSQRHLDFLRSLFLVSQFFPPQELFHWPRWSNN